MGSGTGSYSSFESLHCLDSLRDGFSAAAGCLRVYLEMHNCELAFLSLRSLESGSQWLPVVAKGAEIKGEFASLHGMPESRALFPVLPRIKF